VNATDTELMIQMITHNDIVKKSLTTYRDIYYECTVEINGCSKISTTQHFLQRFIRESVSCHLVTGFVVFRFHEIKENGENKLIPLVVPISEIQWAFDRDDNKYESQIRVPDVFVPLAGPNNKTRFYVYRFANDDGISSCDLGIVFSLMSSYRKFIEIQQYNIELMNQNICKTVFIEQRVIANTTTDSTGGRHSVSSGPLINRILDHTNNYRATTNSEIPPTLTEDIRKDLQVYHYIPLYAYFAIR